MFGPLAAVKARTMVRFLRRLREVDDVTSREQVDPTPRDQPPSIGSTQEPVLVLADIPRQCRRVSRPRHHKAAKQCVPFRRWAIMALALAVPHPHGAGVARIKLLARPHDAAQVTDNSTPSLRGRLPPGACRIA